MTLQIAIVSDPNSWMAPYLTRLTEQLISGGHLTTVYAGPTYKQVDIAFFLSYPKIVGPEVLARARSNVVVHGSALPEGKGWSPWTWQILEGRNELALTLFEAQEGVDSGPIYDQRFVSLTGTELIGEWQARQADMTLSMCADFVNAFPAVLEKGRPQSGQESFYPRRRPADSKLDPGKTIAEQFNLLRIVDNLSYPAYFEHDGQTYELSIRRRT